MFVQRSYNREWMHNLLPFNFTIFFLQNVDAQQTRWVWISNMWQSITIVATGQKWRIRTVRRWITITWTLFASGGGGIYLPHVCVYMCIQDRWKNFTFLTYEFEKRALHFSPCKVILFCWRNQSSSKLPKFHKGSNASPTKKNFKRQTFFRVLGITTPWILSR